MSPGRPGRSYVKRTDVAPYLGDKFVSTLLLTLVAMGIAVTLGLIADIASAAPRVLPTTC
jgi:ABC-type dipeptide/oligopeptide/nickel transport system permease component